MMWWLVVFSSAGLIALGTGLLVRDLLLSRPGRVQRPSKRLHEARETLSQSVTNALSAVLPERGPITRNPDTHPPATTRHANKPPRSSALEKKWSRVRKEVEAAVLTVNGSMQQLSIAIGTPGQPTWNLENDGFGDYRRVRIEQESVAWLRLEITPDLCIRLRLRTHDAQFANLNRDAVAAADRSADDLALAIKDSIAGIFDFAVKRQSDFVRQEAPATNDRIGVTRVNSAPSNAASQATTGTHQPHAIAPAPPTAPLPASMPSPSAALVDAAVSLVNRAFAEAGAVLVPAENRGATKVFSDRTLSIISNNAPVGLMIIEPRSDRIDISVGTLDQINSQSMRKQSHPMSGLTVHSLAEAIATNAWPAIAAAATRTAVA